MLQVIGAIALSILAVAAPPTLPFVQKDASVGECARYGTWWADAKIPVYKHERDTSLVAFYLQPHERFKGLTGNVTTLSQGWVIVPRSEEYQRDGLRPGEKLYLLAPDSEGFWNAWHQGKVISVNMAGLMDRQHGFVEPHWEWWAKVHSRKGQFGWILMNESNAQHIWGLDSCGVLPDWAEQDRKSIPQGDYWYTDSPHS
jgi:hypothetical protein